MPRLQVLNGKRQGAIFDIAPNSEHVIGHRATAAIPIDDPWVSWDHARLFFDGNGTCAIEDLGSTNGTYVNCVRVKRERLSHEDIIFLGKTHVIFLAPVEEGQQTAFARASSGSHLLGGAPFVDSEHGAFQSTGATPLVAARPKDPFASTAPNRASGSGSRAGFQGGQDPFAESSVDPFATGPDPSFPSAIDNSEFPGFEDFSGAGGTSKLTRGELDDLGQDPFGIEDPFGGPLGAPAADPFGPQGQVIDPFGAQADPLESGILRANLGGGYHVNDLSDPAAGRAPVEDSEESTIPLSRRGGKRSNPFAETRGDEEVSPLHDSQRQRPSRSLSLSSLGDNGEPELPGPTPREITDLLGDDNALSALDDPAFGLSSDGLAKLDKLDPSEMRTRMLDTARVSELIA
ncbi:MAG TPA: hypothetical protein DEA08_24155, partial [Planctomycetes bacterium]|nr:hypothetical protein [Planctomycetota bacterium]